jgi:hypothetical protein
MSHSVSSIDIKALESCIDRAVDFLASHQLPYGEFKTYVAPGNSLEENCQFDSSPFTTSLVVYSLSFLPNTRVGEIREKALNFLANEMESSGLWRFWSSKNLMHRLIPPDMDDTCCASFVLKKYRTAPPNKKLILANRNKQGLFYTWFLPRFTILLTNATFWLKSLPETPTRFVFWRKTEAEPDDIDCAVNANVVLYLNECEETKAAIAYLIEVTLSGTEVMCDKWYLSKFPYYYMLSRAYFNGVEALGAVKSTVITALEQMLDTNEECSNPLDIALATCTLMNFNHQSEALHKAIISLLETQKSDGAWSRVPLYYGGPKKYYGWGSPELTTGFCVEAIARYLSLVKR